MLATAGSVELHSTIFVQCPGGADVQLGERHFSRAVLGEDPERLADDGIVPRLQAVPVAEHKYGARYLGHGFLRRTRGRWFGSGTLVAVLSQSIDFFT